MKKMKDDINKLRIDSLPQFPKISFQSKAVTEDDIIHLLGSYTISGCSPVKEKNINNMDGYIDVHTVDEVTVDNNHQSKEADGNTCDAEVEVRTLIRVKKQISVCHFCDFGESTKKTVYQADDELERDEPVLPPNSNSDYEEYNSAVDVSQGSGETIVIPITDSISISVDESITAPPTGVEEMAIYKAVPCVPEHNAIPGPSGIETQINTSKSNRKISDMDKNVHHRYIDNFDDSDNDTDYNLTTGHSSESSGNNGEPTERKLETLKSVRKRTARATATKKK
ncbi:unnamed protein product [Mytilus edulis]|uniref:Uncharacterized protein n=1 Tax=Mytilus edulis TaxID=6550 RepID=A0A8S3SU67_MYTED|nr:unnamed protein product [Mytilus edulis]